ncbi:hypothetical protein ACOME3_007357 [Neoechinorhynchus agilis]
MALLNEIFENSPYEGTTRLVVMDPPWSNKSLRRHKLYKWLNNEDLLAIPISKIASESGCMIACWCTNCDRHIEFVKAELFPKWSVQYFQTYYWLKVTQDGDAFVRSSNGSRRTYEPLLLGLYRGVQPKEWHFPKDSVVFASVPSMEHSTKPPLYELFKSYMGDCGADSHQVELFARSLYPGILSWGNEVLKMQACSYFEFQDAVVARTCNMKTK